MTNPFATAAAALIAAAILTSTGAWRVLKAAGFVLQLLAGLFILTPFWAIRRRLFGDDALLRRRINAARMIA